MQKHLFALFFLAFVLTKSSANDLSQEFSLDAEPQYSSFLGLGDEPGEVSSFSLDLFNVTDLFDASAMLDSVQGMVEPIGQGIESVGQQIDAAFDGLQDVFQDMVNSIQAPLNEQLDVVWTWVSGDEAQPVKIELGESPSRVRAEEDGISNDDQYVLEITVSDDVEVKVIEEREAQYDENGYSERDEIEVIMFQEEPMEIVEVVETPVAVPVSVEMPVSVPIGDIDEIVVLVDYTDIAAAMNNPNTTPDSIEKDLFYVRFFEAYMGKEIELELKSANLSPVEESNKKSQVLSYDAL